MRRLAAHSYDRGIPLKAWENRLLFEADGLLLQKYSLHLFKSDSISRFYRGRPFGWIPAGSQA